jgi:hypothetical protein
MGIDGTVAVGVAVAAGGLGFEGVLLEGQPSEGNSRDAIKDPSESVLCAVFIKASTTKLPNANETGQKNKRPITCVGVCQHSVTLKVGVSQRLYVA